MRSWLAAAAAVPLAVSCAAHAQAGSVQPAVPAEKAHAALSYKLPETRDFTAQSPVKDGVIAQEELAPNAHLNLGLAPMRGRNIHSVREEQELVPTNNPGVSFVIKFRR